MKVIAESKIYKSGIYRRCTARLVSHAGRYYIHQDGVRWVGNTCGFHVWKTKLSEKETAKVIAMLADYEAGVSDELSDWLRGYPASEPAYF